MTPSGDLVFPLISSHRGGALDVAGSPSRRRGSGSEIASSRPYRRGDAIRLVDWAASARLSTARGTDEFVVRDHFAEDAVRIVVIVDRSPSMALFPRWLPWLDKDAAVRTAGRMIVASGAATNALVGFAAAGADGGHVMPSRRDRAHRRAIEQRLATGAPDGPSDSLDRAFALLSRAGRSVPPGTFVFVLSDFLPPPSAIQLADARGGRVGSGSGRRPGSRVGALVSRRLGCHPSSRRPRQRRTVTRPAQPQRGTGSSGSQRAARRGPRPRPPRPRARSGHDHEQRCRRGAPRIPVVGGAATRSLARLSVSGRTAALGRTSVARLLAVGLVLGAAVAAAVVAVLVHRPSRDPPRSGSPRHGEAVALHVGRRIR